MKAFRCPLCDCTLSHGVCVHLIASHGITWHSVYREMRIPYETTIAKAVTLEGFAEAVLAAKALQLLRGGADEVPDL
jgi:hypothetical protein